MEGGGGDETCCTGEDTRNGGGEGVGPDLYFLSRGDVMCLGCCIFVASNLLHDE